ncbi:MAG: hypothetical protein FD133_150 [Erysipelotrichaceae bacterium]|nr:MAG: hypothetical protein FD179_531 [Erysipelotrichaceae bacterium]TXT19799.1 MAG: hypothetical protein FD133_150 [Erysipelotrichaceae bacterium]
MTQWMITTYSQKKLLDYKKIGVLVLIPLFFLINFLVCIPYFVGFFSMSTENLLSTNEGLKPALIQMFDQTECDLDVIVTCSQSNVTTTTNGYLISILPTAKDTYGPKEIVVLPERLIITNAQSIILVSGSFENIGATSFDELSSSIANDNEVLNIIIKDVVLSELSANMMRQYLLLFFQNLIYVFVLAGALFIGFGWKSKKKLSFMESLSINTQMMFSPALLSAFVGMYNPGWAVVLFPTLLTLRFLLLYRVYIRIKL